MTKPENIVDLGLRRRKAIVKNIRIHHDEFEYRLLEDYDEKIDLMKTDCIQLADCFAQVTKNQGHYILLSILLEKKAHSIDSVVNWIEKHKVRLFSRDIESIQIKHVGEVLAAVCFRSQPIILYSVGPNTITLEADELQEVTTLYKHYKAISNTADYIPVLDRNDKDKFGLIDSDYLFDDLDKDDMLAVDYPYSVETDEDK